VRVIGTAGHVDHGKSSLVLALTGIDPDRFAEEKRRGLTIDLGFAWTTLPSGAEVSFVDVPGHVRFLKNMLAGVGAIDACVFVVAATEGWKPQSEEHLRILELLGVRHGIVALTKVDLLDQETTALAELDVSEHVVGSFLEGVAVVPVAAPIGRGLTDLHAALDALVAVTPAAIDRDRPRLWVDRAFAARGAGTVVTGTLTGGSFAVGDAVAVGPRREPARIRAIQSREQPVDRIGPGNRVALNLSGIDHRSVTRGAAVVSPGRWHDTKTVDASLGVLAGIDHDVSRRGAYLAYVGSGEYPVRLRMLGREHIAPGGEGAVRLYLATALPLLPGDRYVLRESGRDETVGGGEILDVAPVLPAARARPDRSIDRMVAERGWIDAVELERLTGESRASTLGRWVATPEAVAMLVDGLAARVAVAADVGLDVATLDERERLALVLLPDVVVDGGRVRPADAGDPLSSHPALAELEAGGCTPPAVALSPSERRELVRRGLVVDLDGLLFAPSALDHAARVAARLLTAGDEGATGGFTVAAFRDAVGATRKHAVPLLAELDRRGVTRRRGDLRIAGPRLPAGG
jgi:selenocysteine-specific elongation factor